MLYSSSWRCNKGGLSSFWQLFNQHLYFFLFSQAERCFCFLIDYIAWKRPINNLLFPAMWLDKPNNEQEISLSAVSLLGLAYCSVYSKTSHWKLVQTLFKHLKHCIYLIRKKIVCQVQQWTWHNCSEIIKYNSADLLPGKRDLCKRAKVFWSFSPPHLRKFKDYADSGFFSSSLAKPKSVYVSIPIITGILDIAANKEEPYDLVIFIWKGKRAGRNPQHPNRGMVLLHWEFSVNGLSFLKPRLAQKLMGLWILIEF